MMKKKKKPRAKERVIKIDGDKYYTVTINVE